MGPEIWQPSQMPFSAAMSGCSIWLTRVMSMLWGGCQLREFYAQANLIFSTFFSHTRWLVYRKSIGWYLETEPGSGLFLPVLEYRGTVLVNKTEFAAQIAGLDLALLTENLRISGFSQLYDDEKNSPSFCLSFERSDVTIRRKSYRANSWLRSIWNNFPLKWFQLIRNQALQLR